MKQIKSQEDEFYRELDQKTEPKSFCNFYTMIIFFFGLVVLSCLLVIFIGFRLRNANYSVFKNYIPIISEKISKDPSIINKDQNLRLVILADDLNSSLPRNLKSYSVDIVDPRISINPAAFVVEGSINTGLKLPIRAESQPTARDGRVILLISAAKVGFVPMPGMVRVGLEKSVNNYMDSNLNSVYNLYEVTGVELRDNEMVILGKLR